MRRLAAGGGRMTGTAARRDRSGGRRWDAEQALTALYDRHYRALTKLAVLLVDDIADAEEVAQAAFAALHGAGRLPPDGDRALSCLRRTVISRARAHRAARPRQPQAGHQAQAGGDALLMALRALPDLQREALVLRYYANLADDQIASAMGIGVRSVHVHVSRGMAALHAALDGRGPWLPPVSRADRRGPYVGSVIEARPRDQIRALRPRRQGHQPIDPNDLGRPPGVGQRGGRPNPRPSGLLDSAAGPPGKPTRPPHCASPLPRYPAIRSSRSPSGTARRPQAPGWARSHGRQAASPSRSCAAIGTATPTPPSSPSPPTGSACSPPRPRGTGRRFPDRPGTREAHNAGRSRLALIISQHASHGASKGPPAVCPQVQPITESDKRARLSVLSGDGPLNQLFRQLLMRPVTASSSTDPLRAAAITLPRAVAGRSALPGQ